MDHLAQNPFALYLVIGLLTLWYLPSWGRRVLAFLRDYRNFRNGRPP
jgi:hypothetical protein